MIKTLLTLSSYPRLRRCSFQAAKFLSDKGWEQKRGRPSKAEKAKALKQEAALTLALEDDMARVLTVVK